MPEERFYTEEEANEILRAAQMDPGTSGMSRDELLRSALEAGIPPEAIERAEQQVTLGKQSVSDQEGYRQHLHRALMTQVSSWFGTSILLAGINLMTGFHSFWSAWPIGIWGLVVLKEAIEYGLSKPWLDPKKVEKWRRKQATREAQSAEVEAYLRQLPEDVRRDKDRVVKDLTEKFGLRWSEARHALDEFD
ncbi:MAG: 2TM domain-containing protein [Fimbriimonadaceae bacterium]|nr:2TM domain-containing protein [Fimbriimonadaceae bacterium]